MIKTLIELTLKFFFVFTPFFALSMFLVMTSDKSDKERKSLAVRVGISSIVISACLFFFGQWIFKIFGITVDAFRIGAGILLLLSAINLMNPQIITKKREKTEDITVVPLAMPIIIGPASCGTIMVLSAELNSIPLKLIGFSALAIALGAVFAILSLSTWIDEKLGKRGISILMRITALILAALSAQMIMTGAVGFF